MNDHFDHFCCSCSNFCVSLFLCASDTDTVTPLSLLKGEDVTLNTDAELQTDDQILWMFGNSPIAKIKRGDNFIYDGPDGRFKDRLKLNQKSGSLIITDIRPNTSGLYVVEITKRKSSYTTHKTFRVTIIGESL